MEKRPIPISIARNLTNRVATDSADSLLAQARAGNAGIAQRIVGMDKRSTPCVYTGATTYYPESGSILVDVEQTGMTTAAVNYILHSGQDYSIPIIAGGDGVFLAHSVRMTMWQAYKNSAYRQPVQLTVVPMTNDFVAGSIDWTTKFSIIGVQPDEGSSPSINLRWNLQEGESGQFYSDNYLPLCALQNRSLMKMHTLEAVDDADVLSDGGEHEFDASYRFEKAQTMFFIFRPLTDIYQLATMSNGINSQPVTVQVELIGERIGGSL